MKLAYSPLFVGLIALCACNTAWCQQPQPQVGIPTNTCAAGPTSCASNAIGIHWAHGCFPRCDCPDDYCPNPLPRQCWPPYPPFYRCVPAGSGSSSKDKLTWWFIPNARALREALWCQP
jgi:hypothetical protein